MYFEFQSKGSHAPEWKLKHPDYSSLTSDRKITYIKDGERIIAKQLDETLLGNVKWWTIEDIDGNITTINSCLFHKITDPKLFSKKFKFFKVQNHIVD